MVLDRSPKVLKPGAVIQLCFECSQWQEQQSPCTRCGSPCESFELPIAEPRSKTLLEVLGAAGMLDEEDE